MDGWTDFVGDTIYLSEHFLDKLLTFINELQKIGNNIYPKLQMDMIRAIFGTWTKLAYFGDDYLKV